MELNLNLNLNLNLIFTFISALILMSPAAAAEMVTNRTCNVSRLRDDLYKYQLSSPSQCKMGWEDVNKTAYAHDFEFDPQRVHNVSREYILLKSCQDYMHFTDDCLKHEAVEEVHCRVNCTLLSALTVIEDLPSTSVPNNRICFSESVCVDWWKVALVIGCLTVLPAAGLMAVHIWRRIKKRRTREGGEAISYTPADGEVKVQMMSQTPV